MKIPDTIKQKANRDKDQRRGYGSSLVTFFNKKGFVDTVRQLLISWALWRAYVGSWDTL